MGRADRSYPAAPERPRRIHFATLLAAGLALRIGRRVPGPAPAEP